MWNLHYKKNIIGKFVAVAVIIGQILSMSGCGLISSMDPDLQTAPKIGSNIIVDRSTKKISVSHDITRFHIEGTNAFYIPEGLENDPRDIRAFDVLDYTDDGEFIYHMITPAFITADEVRSLKTDSSKSEGTVSKNGFKEVDRSGGQKSDAELLMAYKPDTGHYRILEARGYELEWNPETEDKPDFFTTPIQADGGKAGLIFMKDRGFANKIPEKDEYFIADTSGTGTVYDINGNVVFSTDYSNDITFQQAWHQELSTRTRWYNPNQLNDPTNEEDKEFEEFRKKRENRNVRFPDSLRLILTDIAMNSDYYSYISCASYKGESPVQAGAYLSGFTFASYRQNITRNSDGLSDFVSVNLNALKQEELWRSIEGKYFGSRSEMENDPAYSMEKIKTTGEYADNFTPFITNPEAIGGEWDSYSGSADKTTVSEDAAFIVGDADFRNLSISGFNTEDMDRVVNSYRLPQLDSNNLRWYMGEYNSNSSSKRDKLFKYWRDKSSISGKRGFRAAHGIFIERLLQDNISELGQLKDYIDKLEKNGLLPRMGRWNESKQINESQMNSGEETPQSLHILRIKTDEKGLKTSFCTQIDPIKAEVGDSRHSTMEEEKVTVVPTSSFMTMSRTCWYHSEREAEEKRKQYKEWHPELAETIDRIYEILSAKDIEKDVSGNFISDILNDSHENEEEAAAEAIDELSKMVLDIPLGDMDYVLSICADYVDETIRYEAGKYPVIYTMCFPESAGAEFNRNIQRGTSIEMGRLKEIKDGVLIACDDQYSTRVYSEFIKFSSGSDYTDASEESPGESYEIGELVWRRPRTNEKTKYYTYRTSLGIRFFSCTEDGKFEPLQFSGDVKNIWKKPLSNQVTYSEIVTRGFIPYENLLVSSGYTRDTENRTVESVDEVIKDAGGKTEDLKIDRKTMDDSKNDRYIGSIASADSFALIGSHTALICAVNGGTRILNLQSGDVIDEKGDGSFYRAFQVGNSNHYKLLGFDTDAHRYLDTDLPMAKIYDKVYESDEGEKIDETLLESICETLRQMAKDYLYRHYRTKLDENDSVIKIKMPEGEKQENISEEKLFESGSPDDTEGEFHTELKRLEKLYGIESDPEQVLNYTIYLRKQAASVKPAITRLYMIAGATALATSDTREGAYWKNLDSRITMAEALNTLQDILVEIRMHPDAESSISAEQVKKYQTYKTVLDFTAEQGKVTYDDTDPVQKVSDNEIKEKYRNDVLNDIKEDFEKLHPETDFEETLRELLDKVNPDNLLIGKEDARAEFIEIINKGESSLSDELYDAMKERLESEIPKITSVWEMEKLIISEKIRQPKFVKYKDSFDKYETDSRALSTKDQATLLRKQDFYKEIIGGLKSDAYVKEFLKGKRETWDDYIKEIIINSGAGTFKDEDGMVEDSLFNSAIEGWRKLSEGDPDQE